MSGPLLIICCGLPGVGKSTVSEYATKRLGATRYRTDEVRYDLFDDPEYTPAEMRKTYDELLDRVRAELVSGADIVVDGTFKQPRERERAAAIAEETGATVRFVRVTCPEDVVQERIEQRTNDASDADLSVYYELRDQFEPIAREHLVIDNSGSLVTVKQQVDQKLLASLDG